MARPRKVTAADQAKEEGMVRVVVLRDFWPTDDDADRVRAGAVIDVTADEAMDGLESGTMARMKA